MKKDFHFERNQKRPHFGIAFVLTLAFALLPAVGHTADFSVARYGARGDGITLDTAGIQQAIEAAAKNGGTVVFPAGTYLTGSIFVKSGVTLKIDKGVILLSSQNIKDYPVMPSRIAGIEMSWPAALVDVYKQSNAQITGEGTIDGAAKCSGILTGRFAKATSQGSSLGLGLRCTTSTPHSDLRFLQRQARQWHQLEALRLLDHPHLLLL